jgi:hypothetical protein
MQTILLPGTIVEVMDYDHEQGKTVKKLYMVLTDQTLFDDSQNINNFIAVKLSTNLHASAHKYTYTLRKNKFDFLSSDSVVLLHTIKYFYKDEVLNILGTLDYFTRLFISVRLYGFWSTLYASFQKKY